MFSRNAFESSLLLLPWDEKLNDVTSKRKFTCHCIDIFIFQVMFEIFEINLISCIVKHWSKCFIYLAIHSHQDWHLEINPRDFVALATIWAEYLSENEFFILEKQETADKWQRKFFHWNFQLKNHQKYHEATFIQGWSRLWKVSNAKLLKFAFKLGALIDNHTKSFFIHHSNKNSETYFAWKFLRKHGKGKMEFYENIFQLEKCVFESGKKWCKLYFPKVYRSKKLLICEGKYSRKLFSASQWIPTTPLVRTTLSQDEIKTFSFSFFLPLWMMENHHF